ncbi:MAG: S8 family serine peptidase [Oculatellaceae cyanobacterium bins.114]|nr:S8 family serine peptidase [Oculatellaceae cyanobacterium bins.114]
MAQWRMAKRLAWLAGGVTVFLAGAPVLASIASIGEGGIDALRLRTAPYTLTGAKIAIGQVEIGRPAQFGLDKAGANNLVVVVGRLFHQDNLARANDFVDGHAGNVASVMISQDKEITGVAPNARLYSSAVGFIRRTGQPQECLASQTVASQNGGDVRAINFSFGESLLQDPRPDAVLDGNALLTQCIDWSSQVHDVLYVIAGNQGGGGIPIPTDNFNGMTVANSTQVDGVFRKVDFSNLGSEPTVVLGRRPDSESNVGPRRSVSLVAPGTNILMLNPDGSPTRATGTSFAAPHVTATVALVQEYGDRQIRERQPHWSLDARRHQVTKVVLMNSADKIQDQGDGLLLGMSRTVVDQVNTNWLQSDAYRDPKIPLHAELGTGHLNAYRAIQQFSPGQWSSEAPVPAIGWDYSSVAEGTGATSYRDYVLEQPLQKDSYVSITLGWDRPVELQDANGNGQYDVGETFADKGLNNLDIYLMRADDTNISDSVWSSVSEVDSVEHIFNQVPETGRYKIRVVYRDRVNDSTQNYALAWWTVPAR